MSWQNMKRRAGRIGCWAYQHIGIFACNPRQEDWKFKARLGNLARAFLKTTATTLPQTPTQNTYTTTKPRMSRTRGEKSFQMRWKGKRGTNTRRYACQAEGKIWTIFQSGVLWFLTSGNEIQRNFVAVAMSCTCIVVVPIPARKANTLECSVC